MDEPLSTGEILARAVAYPYEAPLASFVQRDGQARRLDPGALELEGRRPLLAYGSNASPAILTGKLAAHPHQPLPMLRAELVGFDIVYSAHISAYGSVPSTLQRSPGTTVPAFVAYPTTCLDGCQPLAVLKLGGANETPIVVAGGRIYATTVNGEIDSLGVGQ